MKNIPNAELLDELKKRLNASNNCDQDLLRQLRELNEKLKQSEAIKSHFISNIRNEINNPLGSILALAQNVLRKANDLPEEITNGLRMISNEAHSLDFQIDNIITAAEIESGSAMPQLVEVNVLNIIRQLPIVFNYVIARKGVDVQISGDDNFSFVTDPHYFRIIIANLLSNAIKFSKKGSDVKVHVTAGDQLMISVTNVGTSISEEDINKIFNRFTQLDEGASKKFLGHGLGLSVIQDLVELLGGKVSVHSDVEHSTFTIALPKQSSFDGFSNALGDGDEILFDQSV